MKHSSTPPPAMSTYRPRLVEVHALDCGDGRHVLLTEPPRYMPTAEFEAAFELVPAHRNGGRAKAATRQRKGSKRSKVVRRAKGSASGDDESKKAEAQRLFEKDGVKLAEIARRLKIPYSGLYYWSRQWKAPAKAAKAEKGDEPWME